MLGKDSFCLPVVRFLGVMGNEIPMGIEHGTADAVSSQVQPQAVSIPNSDGIAIRPATGGQRSPKLPKNDSIETGSV